MKMIQDQTQLKHYLQAHGIEDVFNGPMMNHLSLYTFDEGELICSQGEAADHLYVLVKGKVKIYTTSAEGKTLILSFKTPLEIIGDIEYVRSIPIINTVEAVSPVTMMGIQRRWLMKYGQDHAPLLNFLLNIVTHKFYLKSNFLSFNLMYPVEVRLASYLLSVSFDESNAMFKGKLKTSSLRDAANLIGTSYRHLNRVIQKMCEEGMVERSRGYLLVKDRQALTAVANRNLYE
ncbi:cyclic nucleotide-binding domain-containing protein [Paenibacillus sp. JX-17]|uniref:Cyclic nucleotide-binding domain-containing protein n=1 Tax=Paenibacillus lacisoli TaxID=3064525 RepID=A0ABT9CHB8_9BACL|nr:cyclic nucleotide-binding domain-containing protein [Paenibacillus sp. JX-17]MDO7908034.1 cyclic nucleotide-binding domain-containing protein [Paenibacillus sp. JX-17]